MGSSSFDAEYDAVLIGAGFGGFTMLPKYVHVSEGEVQLMTTHADFETWVYV